jgi:hypothetical protein
MDLQTEVPSDAADFYLRYPGGKVRKTCRSMLKMSKFLLKKHEYYKKIGHKPIKTVPKNTNEMCDAMEKAIKAHHLVIQ